MRSRLAATRSSDEAERPSSLAAIHHREHFADHRDSRGADEHHKDAREDENHEREDEFDRGFGGLFFSQLAAAGAHRIALHAQACATLEPNLSA